MVEVHFSFNSYITKIHAKKEEKMEEIFKRFAFKAQVDINNKIFLYNGEKVNKQLTFIELANFLDRETGKMVIIVDNDTNDIDISKKDKDLKKSREIICPKCNENCLIKIKDYKIFLYGCKNGHKIDNIFLDEFYKTQNINESEIICNNCKNVNKKNSYQNQFYKCLTCKQNICPICNLKHNKSHDIIDYDNKNYICEIHNDSYNSYCEICKMNMCMLCESEHNVDHKKILYSNIIKNIRNKNKIKEDVENLKKNIEKFNNDIKSIIYILNNIINNMNIFYQINYDIINNFEIKKKNYEILKNVNEINNNFKLNEIEELLM